MHTLFTRFTLLIFLIAPLATYGQERVYVISEGWGAEVDRLKGGGEASFQAVVRLAFTNLERRIGPGIWLMHRFTAGTYTGYEIGVVRMNKHFIITVLGGPFVTTPLLKPSRGWAWNGGVSVGIGFMPATAIGMGLSARRHLRGIAFSLDFIVRPRWTGEYK